MLDGVVMLGFSAAFEPSSSVSLQLAPTHLLPSPHPKGRDYGPQTYALEILDRSYVQWGSVVVGMRRDLQLRCCKNKRALGCAMLA